MVQGTAPLRLQVKTIRPLALHSALGQDTSGTLRLLSVWLVSPAWVWSWAGNPDSRTPSQGWGGRGPRKRRDLVGPLVERPSGNGKPSREAGEPWSYGETPHAGSHHVGPRGQTPRSVKGIVFTDSLSATPFLPFREMPVSLKHSGPVTPSRVVDVQLGQIGSRGTHALGLRCKRAEI